MYSTTWVFTEAGAVYNVVGLCHRGWGGTGRNLGHSWGQMSGNVRQLLTRMNAKMIRSGKNFWYFVVSFWLILGCECKWESASSTRYWWTSQKKSCIPFPRDSQNPLKIRLLIWLFQTLRKTYYRFEVESMQMFRNYCHPATPSGKHSVFRHYGENIETINLSENMVDYGANVFTFAPRIRIDTQSLICFHVYLYKYFL